MKYARFSNLQEVVLQFDYVACRTEAACLLSFGDEKVWIPERHISWIDEREGEVLVPEWVALDKGLEIYIKD